MAPRQLDETGKWEELPLAVILETRSPARLFHGATTFWGLGCTAEALYMIFIFGHLGALTQPAAVRVMQGEPAGEQACNIAIVALVGVLQTMAHTGFFSFLFHRRRLTFLLDMPQTLSQLVAISKTGRKKRFLNWIPWLVQTSAKTSSQNVFIYFFILHKGRKLILSQTPVRYAYVSHAALFAAN